MGRTNFNHHRDSRIGPDIGNVEIPLPETSGFDLKVFAEEQQRKVMPIKFRALNPFEPA